MKDCPKSQPKSPPALQQPLPGVPRCRCECRHVPIVLVLTTRRNRGPRFRLLRRESRGDAKANPEGPPTCPGVLSERRMGVGEKKP